MKTIGLGEARGFGPSLAVYYITITIYILL